MLFSCNETNNSKSQEFFEKPNCESALRIEVNNLNLKGELVDVPDGTEFLNIFSGLIKLIRILEAEISSNIKVDSQSNNLKAIEKQSNKILEFYGWKPLVNLKNALLNEADNKDKFEYLSEFFYIMTELKPLLTKLASLDEVTKIEFKQCLKDMEELRSKLELLGCKPE